MADAGVSAPAPRTGEILFCGASDFATHVSGTRNEKFGDIVRPSRISCFMGEQIRYVTSGPSACHAIIITADGRTFTMGRNHKGQLGHGDGGNPVQMRLPKELLSPIRIIGASCGKGHTLLAGADGKVYAVGDNSCGQLGLGHTRSVVKVTSASAMNFDGSAKGVACGAEFSVVLSDNGGVYCCGKPEYGQCGNGTNGEYFITASKLAFDNVLTPQRITEGLTGVHVVDIACGNNHSAALTEEGQVYTWGFGGYGRLGHKVQKDEMVPRAIEFFGGSRCQALAITCGASCTLAVTESGATVMCGRNKNTGEPAMYPKPVDDLRGWRVAAMSAGNTSIVMSAEKSVIAWGPSPARGELGFGKDQGRSSTVPKKMDSLEGFKICQIACGHSCTWMIVTDTNEDELKKLAKFKPKQTPLLDAAEFEAVQAKSKKGFKKGAKKGAAAAAPKKRAAKAKAEPAAKKGKAE